MAFPDGKVEKSTSRSNFILWDHRPADMNIIKFYWLKKLNKKSRTEIFNLFKRIQQINLNC